MKSKVYKNKTFAFLAVLMFIGTGTYNAVVINSESHLAGSDIKFVKRLDEVYGVTVAGREVAASMNWQKLNPQEVAEHKARVAPQVVQTISTAASAPAVEQQEVIPAAAVQEELSLNLVEVINPRKWQKGLTTTEFNGNLATNNGVIESLNISLPNGEGVSVSFSEMVGNVFEYDLDGELYSGMMYQVDQSAYMVTLTNGPLEGTRLRFTAEPSVEQQEQNQQQLADNNIEPGNFGQEQIQAEEQQPETQQAYAQEQVEQENLVADQQMPMNEQAATNYDQQLQMQGSQQLEQQQQF